MANRLFSLLPRLRLDDDDDDDDDADEVSGADSHEVSSRDGSATSNHENGLVDDDDEEENLSSSGSSAESTSTQESNCKGSYASIKLLRKIPTADEGKDKILDEIVGDNGHLPADNLLRLCPVSYSMADYLSSQLPRLRLDDDVADAIGSGADSHEVSSNDGSAASNHENGFLDDEEEEEENLSSSGNSAESFSPQESKCKASDASSKLFWKIPERGNDKKLDEIVRNNVLRHLPADNLLRLSLVSTSWDRLISSPFFRHCQAYTHRSVSGVFFRPNDKPAFASFGSGSGSVPDAELSFLPKIIVLSSSNGLLLCYAQSSSIFFVCNPITTAFTAIPKPHVSPGSFPAAVLIFLPGSFNFRGDFSIVVASRNFWFQTFSSATGDWCISNHESPVDWVLPASGVSIGGSAFWRSTMRTVVRYDPKSDRTSNLLSPMPSESDARWEIGEMGGQLHCVVVTQTEVLVYKLVKIPDEWALVENLHWITWLEADETEEQATSCCMLELEERPWPIKFQSGDDEILLWTAGLVIAVNVTSKDIRLAEVDFGKPPTDEGSEYAAHISTFAVAASSPDNPRPKSSSSESAPPSWPLRS